MFGFNEKWPTTVEAEQVALERAQREIQEEKNLDFRKVEALERIAESLESIRSAQWMR